MSDPQSPYIVRPAPPVYFAKPGLHSHNANRRDNRVKRAFSALHGIRLVLLLFGLAALGYYGYTLSDEYIYEAYQNWAFDQQIAGRAHVTFADYVRERTPFGFVVGEKAPVSTVTSNTQPLPLTNQAPLPVPGSVLGRVAISRLNLAAVVREGVDAKVLSVAVGHVPSTALPGQPGNFAIAAHRDTLFRALKDIRDGDLISFQSPSGTYTYKVVATKIVRPSDVSVLQPDGGGLIPQTQLVNVNNQPNKLLTMITCYPFYYVGSAPKRFIVEAALVGGASAEPFQPNQVSDASPPASSPPVPLAKPARRRLPLQSELIKPRHARGSSHSENTRRAPQSTEPTKQNAKKRGLWHRIFRIS
jgi:sortase A